MKPSLAQGTRDFNATTVRKRNYILDTIKDFFALYGFEPLETPAIENLTTLTGKYGEEGDRLIFKIINNGLNEVAKHEKSRAALENILSGKSDANLTDRALRYDLTIPFARFVAMNRNEIVLPFKRYQTQPVWRADRPQRGRYREFWQCDADVVGSNSLLFEAELLNIYYSVFQKLNVPKVVLKINNRKILSALAQHIGQAENLTNITIAIDKFDKIGEEGVHKELNVRGIDEGGINTIFEFLNISGSNEDKLNAVEKLLGNNEEGKLGIEEIKTVLNLLQIINKDCLPEIDFTLARGLDYYTGMIVEVKTNAVNMGSIGGGGRYDNLTGVFDYPNVSGVGISFGVDRIYDVIEELNLFPTDLEKSIAIMFVNFGGTAEIKSIEYMQTLRAKNIACEIFPEVIKFDKQLKYADKRKYPYVAFVGEGELAEGIIKIKNLGNGEQMNLSLEEMISKFV
jgi:histidyl-tRNA synthetase